MDFRDLDVGPAPQVGLDAYKRRRARLAKQLGEGNVLVVATHPPHQYSHDVEYPFRPHSDFWYLTGFAEPRALLILHGGTGRTDLFVQPRKKEAEIWTGRRLGVERARETLDVDRAHSFDDLSGALKDVLGKSKVHAVCDHDPITRRRVTHAAGKRFVKEVAQLRPGGPEAKRSTFRTAPHGRNLLHEMRLIKEPEELRMLQKACDLGVAAHEAAAKQIRPGAHERQVEAAFAHHARHHGSTGVGYPSICGCGPNAAVLHYVLNRDRLADGNTLLIDAGCEWGWYTSDITRTYPVGGEFTRLQSDLYDLVAAAHKAAMREVKPGVHFRKPHEKAVATLAAGLVDMKFLDGSVESVIKEQTFRRYFMHGTSHFLGLDVHDAGSYTMPDGKPRMLKEGMVITIEPGLYFNPDFAACPPRTEGIGIRIEDDVAVTADGRRNMTRALPTERDAVAGMLGR